MPLYDDLVKKLEASVQEILQSKDRVLISLVGKNGTGKSYFGRYLRKNGLGTFGRDAIAVIDDRTMTLETLRVFKRKIRIPRNGADDLQPYLGLLPARKKVVIYINNTPGDKLREADILLKLTTDEETRKKRLRQRYRNEPEKLEKYLKKNDTDEYGIKYTCRLEERV